MPSERKVLSEFIENENIENSDQNVLGPVEYMMGEIAFGANAENVSSAVGDDPGIKRQERDVYHNDVLIIKPAYDHSFVFVNTPDFSPSLEANGHVGSPHLLLNHPPVHGQCCACAHATRLHLASHKLWGHRIVQGTLLLLVVLSMSYASLHRRYRPIHPYHPIP